MNGIVRPPAWAFHFALLSAWCALPAESSAQNAGDGFRGEVEASSAAADSPRPISPPSRSLKPRGKAGEAKPRGAGSFWKTLLALAGVIAAIIVGGKLLRKHAPNLGGGIPAEALEVLGKRVIDRGQQIYLVRIGARVLIVGSSTGGLQTLGEVNDPVEIDYLAGLCRPKQQPGAAAVAQGFLAMFHRHSVQPDEPPTAPPEESNGVEPYGEQYDGERYDHERYDDPRFADASTSADDSQHHDGYHFPHTSDPSHRSHV